MCGPVEVGLKIQLLTVAFHLQGCHSLKEKRSRLAGLKDRLGRGANLALCESDYHDSHHQAEWSFVAIGADIKTVSRILERVSSFLEKNVDAEIIASHREEI